MKIEDQVVSLELAKELKELGVKQDSVFAWYQYVNGKPYIALKALQNCQDSIAIYHDGYAECPKEICDAPTVAELGEMLPPGFYTYYDQYDGWTCSSSWGFYNEETEEEIIAKTVWGALKRPKKNRLWEEAQIEADARAKMLVYLIKEEIIKVEDIK